MPYYIECLSGDMEIFSPLLPRATLSIIILQLLFLLALNHSAERSLLDHDRHNLVENVSCRHGSVLGISVVGRLYLLISLGHPYPDS